MKLKTLALAAAGAALIIGGAAVVAQAQDAVIVPFDPTYAVNPAQLANVCAGGSNARLHLKFSETVLAPARTGVASFTPLRVAVVKENDTPTGLSFPADGGCAGNPIAVAHASITLEGRTEPLLLAASASTGTLSGAARAVMGLRDRGKCPREGRFTVCKGSSEVNGRKIETTAFIAEETAGSTPSGSPYFALCEGARAQMSCEVSDELPGGVSFRIKLPKGPPQLDDLKAVHAQVRAALAAMGP